MNKKLITIILLIVLCCVTIGVFAGCKKHTHEFGEWTIVKEATCIDSGSRTRACSGCDIAEVEEIPALNHDYSWVEGVLPTCTQDGSVGHYECQRCHKNFDIGKNEVNDVTIKASHTVNGLIPEVKATCTTEGVKAHYHCSVCNEDLDEDMNVLSSLVIEKVDHDYSEWIEEFPATCENVGIKGHYECSVCHLYFDANKTVIDDLYITALSHNYGNLINEVPATCGANGSIEHFQCSNCNKYFDKDKNPVDDITIPSLSHTLGDWIDEIPATCIKNGVKGHYECSVCHKNLDENKEELSTIIITDGKHNVGDWIVEIPATCVKEGTKGHYECSLCLKTFDADMNVLSSLVIEKVDHEYGEWVAEIPATCENDGTKGHYECSDCHTLFDGNKTAIDSLVIPALTHNYGNLIPEVPATCNSTGSIAHYQCSNCNKFFDENKELVDDVTTPSLTHVLGEWIDEISATCVSEGTKGHYECSLCHKHFDEAKTELSSLTIEKTAHDYGEWIDEIPSSCVKEGTKGHYECSFCYTCFDKDYAEIDDLVIEKSHSLYLIQEKPATCTQNGISESYRCSNCRQLFDTDKNPIDSNVIAAIGHQYTDLIPETPATTTDNGILEHKDCTVCGLHFDADGNELTDLVIPSISHNLTWVDEIPATCTQVGAKAHFDCSHCEQKFDANYNVLDDLTIPAEHTLSFYKRQEPTCETDGHIAVYVCEICNAVFDEDMIETDDFTLAHIGHSFGDWQEEIAPTCTTDGVKAHKECTNCHKSFDADDNVIRTVIKASHTLVRHEQVSATCTDDGNQAFDVCSVCNAMFDVFGNKVDDESELIIHADGHNWQNWIDAIPETCTKSGVVGHYHCSKCNKNFDENHDYIQSVSVKATGHVYTTDTVIPEVSATCTEDGSIAHFECATCGAFVTENGQSIESIIIEKTGHVFGGRYNGQLPTCTESGYNTSLVCGVCNSYYSSIDVYTTLTLDDLYLPANGHSYNHYDKTEPSCDVYGFEEHYMCGRCYLYFNTDYEQVDRWSLEIEALKHNLGELITGTLATETEDGTIDHYVCEYCSAYFDADKNKVDTIILPRTEHVFGSWINEVPYSCSTDGALGHYECSHCNGYFDINYQPIDDLTIPAHHTVGELTLAHEGTCEEPDILISYYECRKCYSYLDEDMNVRNYNEIFVYGDHHDFKITDFDQWSHTLECSLCGFHEYNAHVKTTRFYTDENGADYKQESCSICSYESEPEEYTRVTKIVVTEKVYVGYNVAPYIFQITYATGSLATCSIYDIMSQAELDRYDQIIASLDSDFAEFSEVFTVSFENYTKDVSITFTPYTIYNVVTAQNVYQQGYISSLDNLYFVLDTNRSRETNDYYSIYGGTISDDGGFDPDFDFTNYEGTLKTFTIKYVYNEVTYDVEVRLSSDVRASGIRRYYNEDIGINDRLTIDVDFSDGSSKQVEVTPDMVVEGTFDPSVVGNQKFVVEYDGITFSMNVTVHDPYEIRYFYVYTSEIGIGDKPLMMISYYGASSEVVTITSDMILGVFDNTKAGTYSFTVLYADMTCRATVTVIDPNDTSIESIRETTGNALTWDVVDGELVIDVSDWYLSVYRKNRTSICVNVTEDMISFNTLDANYAIQNNGTFEVIITYYGFSTTVNVAPRSIENASAYRLCIVNRNQPDNYYGTSYIYMGDGDLSSYFVRASFENAGDYMISLTKDMLFISSIDNDGNQTLIPFDFENAVNNTEHRVTVSYAGAILEDVTLLIYTRSDAEYSFSSIGSTPRATVGTREEVLNQIMDTKFSLYVYVCGHSSWVSTFSARDLIFDANDDVDFSTPGYVYLKASYNGIVGEIDVIIIPEIEGVDYTEYSLVNKYGTEYDLVLYENSIALYDDNWGYWTLLDQSSGLYEIVLNGESTRKYVIIDENNKAIFATAEAFGGTYEEYVFEMNSPITQTLRVYTKNAISLGDLYYEDEYDSTVLVTFSDDGQFVYFASYSMNNKYRIHDGNKLSVEIEGNVKYTGSQDSDGVITKILFSDTGLAYVYIEVPEESAEYFYGTLTWIEKDGIVTLFDNSGRLILSGIVVDENTVELTF